MRQYAVLIDEYADRRGRSEESSERKRERENVIDIDFTLNSISRAKYLQVYDVVAAFIHRSAFPDLFFFSLLSLLPPSLPSLSSINFEVGRLLISFPEAILLGFDKHQMRKCT